MESKPSVFPVPATVGCCEPNPCFQYRLLVLQTLALLQAFQGREAPAAAACAGSSHSLGGQHC